MQNDAQQATHQINLSWSESALILSALGAYSHNAAYMAVYERIARETGLVNDRRPACARAG